MVKKSIMKKLILGCLLAVSSISLFGQNAQKVNVLKPNIVKASEAGRLAYAQIETADNLYLYYRASRHSWLGTVTTPDAIYVIDKNNYSVSEILFPNKESAGYSLVDMYESETEVYIVYMSKELENKKKIYTVYLNVIDKKTQKMKWQPKKIFSVSMETQENLYYSHAVSPDKTKFAICMFVVSTKKKIKGSVAIAFGENGEQLWKNEFNLEVPNETLSILDCAIDNESVAYFAISSYSDVTKKDRKNEIIHLLKISSDDARFYEEKINFGYISSSIMKISKNGNVILGGYYCDNLTKNEVGSYIAILDTKKDEFTCEAKSFPDDYYKEKSSAGVSNIIYYATVAKHIEEYEDNSFVLLGEMQNFVMATGGTLSFFRFFTRNIPVLYVDADGKISNQFVIKKNQMFVSSMNLYEPDRYSRGLSYKSIMHNNKLYIFFCDAVKNYTGKSKETCVGTLSPKQVSAYCTIEQGDPKQPKVLLNGETDKYRMIIPLFMKEDAVIGIGTNKKEKGEIVEIKHSF